MTPASEGRFRQYGKKLKLALMRLAVHYGYQSASAAAASFRMR